MREIPKMGRKAVHSNLLFIDGLKVPIEDRIGDDGKRFHYILHGMNPERTLIATEAVGSAALRSTAPPVLRERIVLGHRIGQNQAMSTLRDGGDDPWHGLCPRVPVERYFCETQTARIAPVTPQLILSYIAERVLGLAKSY